MKFIPANLPRIKMWGFMKLFNASLRTLTPACSAAAFAQIQISISTVEFIERACVRGATGFKCWCWVRLLLKGMACDDIKSLPPGLVMYWVVFNKPLSQW